MTGPAISRGRATVLRDRVGSAGPGAVAARVARVAARAGLAARPDPVDLVDPVVSADLAHLAAAVCGCATGRSRVARSAARSRVGAAVAVLADPVAFRVVPAVPVVLLVLACPADRRVRIRGIARRVRSVRVRPVPRVGPRRRPDRCSATSRRPADAVRPMVCAAPPTGSAARATPAAPSVR